MRTIHWLPAAICSVVLVMLGITGVFARDYNQRFVRNYPPGYYGMWYNAERFYNTTEPGTTPVEAYRWDKFMSKITDVHFPYYPIPYDWEYGSGRTFNLPNDNRNDWYR